MKKKFFKKLSFVLALAMIISVIAPAAGAFAAAGPKLNSTSKYLHLDVEDLNEFNFNIKNKQSGWKYFWESSDEDVVVVDEKNGVAVATGVGSATVSVTITDKKDKEVKVLSAKVVVRDNIKTVKISNAPEGNKLAVGEEFNFNRSYVTNSGSTTKTSAVTKWAVEPADGATVASNGVFTATKAGTYKLTVSTFQSNAKFKAWSEDAVANADFLLASDTIEIAVAPSMSKAEQVNATTAKLTFDGDMSKELTAANLKAYRVIAGVSQPVDLLIKKVSFDTTGKEVTVEMYIAFVGGENYKFVYDGMENGFVAAKAEADQVAKVVIDTKEIVYTEGAKALEVKLYNADGVDITTTDLKARVTFENVNNVGYLDAGKLILFAKGDVAAIKAIYHTYKYDSNWNEIVVVGEGNVVAVDAASYGLGSTVEWTLGTAAPDWSKAKVTTIAAGDTGYKVYARVQSTKTDATEYYYSYAGVTDKAVSGYDPSKFTFSSSNQDVLIVDASGIIYPVTNGSAIVICNYDGKAIATFPVTITTARTGVEFSLDKSSVVISNSTSVAATDKVKLTLKDQLGDNFFDNAAYDASKVKIEVLPSSPTGVNPVTFANNNKELVITGSGAAKGTWTYKVTAYDKVQILVVTVQEPAKAEDQSDRAAVVYFTLTLDKSTVDVAVAKDSALKSVTPTLTGFASNGVAVFKTDWTGNFFYTVKTGSEDATLDGQNLTDGTIEVAVAGATVSSPAQLSSGPAITLVSGTGVNALAKDKTYVVTAYETVDGVDVVRGTKSFTVTSSKAAPTYTYEKAETTNNYVLQAVRDCFKISLGGNEIADGELYGVTYVVGNNAAVTDTTNNNTVADNTTILVKSVKFVETFTADDVTYAVEYEATINRTITIK